MEKVKINKMGTMPIPKLLILMGIPMIISMTLQAVYNIVDSAFVGNMQVNGEAALNALALAFPIQMLIVSISIGTGVGANALLSKSLGQGDTEKVGSIAGNALFLGGIIYIVFLLFGIFGVPVYVATQTDNELVRQLAVDYLRICCICSLAMILFAMYEKLLQATGKSLFSTIAQVSGALTNIILDPIMIYGLGAMPELGIKGAAWATVIGQVVSCVTGMLFHYILNKDVKSHIKYLRPRGKLILQIYSIGLPAIIAQAIMSFMSYGMNIILAILDPENGTYVTAYGVYYKIQQFALFAAFGVRDALTPVVSFNYGMKNKKRVKDGIKFGVLYTAVLMVVVTIVLEAAAVGLSGVFNLSGTTQDICTNAMRIISAGLLFAGCCIALQGVFQALGSGISSLIVSVCRQLIFVIPLALGFAYLARDNHNLDWLVWFTFIISEGVTAVIAVFLFIRINKRKIAPLGVPVEAIESEATI